MKTNVECRYCGKSVSIDLGNAVMALVRATKEGHIFGGFCCCDCESKIETDEETEEN